MYYLYHIPGKKIGVTRNLNKRVTQTQGYKPNEYEVLDQSDDIDYISKRELELQTSYGYKVDIKPYKNLFKMKVNVTEQTTTFPVPVNKLKGRLMDGLGMVWKTDFGKILLDVETAQWIASNSHTSMFNSDRSYVYNKALWEFYCKHNSLESLEVNTDDNSQVFDNIRTWAKVRGLYEKGDQNTQYVKLQEEAGELAKALLKNDQPEVIDAIGDIVVVLTNLAHIRGTKIETCIEEAYNVISKRTGKMINGTFVKDEL
tara:strand:+ start:908 stop:1681 length:774 start_codon:yes stop_codon:yes gene_type:complete